jgi:predicted metal-dependent hydrolase
MLGPQPATPMTGGCVADVGDRRTTRLWRWWHAPAHHQHLASALALADHGRGIIGKHTRHRLKVANITIDDAKQRDDRGLVGRDGI